MIVRHPALDRSKAAPAEVARANLLRHLEGILAGLTEINTSAAVAPSGTLDAMRAMIDDVARLDFAAIVGGENGPDAARLRAATYELTRIVEGILVRACAFYGLDTAPELGNLTCWSA